MTPYGMVIGIADGKLDEYLKLHQNVPDAVEATMGRHNMRNFHIFRHVLPDGKDYLFCFFEYHGDDFDADMAGIAQCPDTQAWWKLTEPCQQPLPNRAAGEWWAKMTPVVHHLSA